jgi:probable rRNA maturation factor
MPALYFSNQQRTRRLKVRLLREITVSALTSQPGICDWDLTFYFVGAKRMTTINEAHLGHPGPTDVITFDYNDADTPGRIAGEIFICVDIAMAQAREFRTTWQSEIVRYIIHALLHLRGFDDLKPAARRRMKRVENRLLRKLAGQYEFTALGRSGTSKRLGGPVPER